MKSSLCLFLFLLILTSCSFFDKTVQKRSVFFEHQINQYEDSLIHLMIELEESESYLETAELHQVTRTPEEKERQIKNLSEYKTELATKIQSVKILIDSYTDSLLLITDQQRIKH
jgi:hypothetical protein